MFTGIIQSIGKLKKENNILIVEIINDNFDIQIGDSIAVDGICLTITNPATDAKVLCSREHNSAQVKIASLSNG